MAEQPKRTLPTFADADEAARWYYENGHALSQYLAQPEPPMEDLTLAMAADDLRRIEEIAGAQGIPAAELATRWVLERLGREAMGA